MANAQHVGRDKPNISNFMSLLNYFHQRDSCSSSRSVLRKKRVTNCLRYKSYNSSSLHYSPCIGIMIVAILLLPRQNLPHTSTPMDMLVSDYQFYNFPFSYDNNQFLFVMVDGLKILIKPFFYTTLANSIREILDFVHLRKYLILKNVQLLW